MRGSWPLRIRPARCRSRAWSGRGSTWCSGRGRRSASPPASSTPPTARSWPDRGSRPTVSGTVDVTRAGGRYSVPVPASATAGGPSLRALHPTLDEVGTAPVPALGAGQVATVDLTVQPVAPTVVSVAPADGAADQPVGSVVSVLFSEAAVAEHGERVDPDSGARRDGRRRHGAVRRRRGRALGRRTRVVFTPERPLLPGRTFLARFDGGVADAGGTFYDGAPTVLDLRHVVRGGQRRPGPSRALPHPGPGRRAGGDLRRCGSGSLGARRLDPLGGGAGARRSGGRPDGRQLCGERGRQLHGHRRPSARLRRSPRQRGLGQGDRSLRASWRPRSGWGRS